MSSQLTLDGREVLVRIFKYMFEGTVVAFAAFFIPGHKMRVPEVLVIGIIAAATFSMLDLFAPSIGTAARQGAGFGIGANVVGFPGGAPNTGVYLRG